MTKQNDNMTLWDTVEKTNPALTTHVEQRGGFTAICAQYQLKTATALWGPYGDKWGVRNCSWESICKNGEIVEIALSADFFYPAGDHEVSFPLSSDITYRAGNDTRKKLLTDLTTKALSKLGFNADVFMGRFDDNKYVQRMREEFGSTEESKAREFLEGKTPRKPAPKPAAPKRGDAFQRATQTLFDRDLKGFPVGEKDYETIRAQVKVLSGAKTVGEATKFLLTEARLVADQDASGEVLGIRVERKDAQSSPAAPADAGV